MIFALSCVYGIYNDVVTANFQIKVGFLYTFLSNSVTHIAHFIFYISMIFLELRFHNLKSQQLNSLEESKPTSSIRTPKSLFSVCLKSLFLSFSLFNIFLGHYNFQMLEYYNSLGLAFIRLMTVDQVLATMRFFYFCVFQFFSRWGYESYNFLTFSQIRKLPKTIISIFVFGYIFSITFWYLAFTPGGNSYLFEGAGKSSTLTPSLSQSGERLNEHPSFKLHPWAVDIFSELNKFPNEVVEMYFEKHPDKKQKFTSLISDVHNIVGDIQYEISKEVCAENDKNMEQQMMKQSPYGGYCLLIDDFDNWQKSIYLLNEGLVSYLVEYLKPYSVGDFGGGVGVYSQELKKVGIDVRVYDGAIGIQEKTKNYDLPVTFMDLSRRQPIREEVPLFDYVMFLEVGEHIPKKYEHIVLDNVVLHAKKGVIISWAILFSIGPHHINCHSNKWVIGEMERRGFRLNEEETKAIRDSSYDLYKKTLFVFERI